MNISSQKISFFPSSMQKGYKILSKINAGGFSEIFLAESNETNEKVIIKASIKTKDSASKLQKEAVFMQNLKGITGVPSILDEIINEGQEALVIEKLGDSMQKVIQEHMNLSLKSMITVGVQILAILKEIHEKGIIHRDIKPSNILACDINPNQIYLIDYGLAKNFMKDGNHKFLKIKKKKFKGTPMFASRNAHFSNSLSRRDDLESLGYTLAFLYKGFLPWSSYRGQIQRNNFDLGKTKQYWIEKGIFPDMPVEFQRFIEYVRKLNFEESPDYELLTNFLLDMAKRYDLKLANMQWEWGNVPIVSGIDSESLDNENFNEYEEINSQNCDGYLNNLRVNIMIMEKTPIKFGGKKVENNEKKNAFKEFFKSHFNV